MIRSLVAVSMVSALALGCSSAVMQPQVAASEVDATDMRLQGAGADGPFLKVSLPLGDGQFATGTFGMRALGDFVVYRFSGSYREAPVTVSQRVVARTADAVMVDMTVDDRGELLRLRLRMDDRAASRGEVLGVTKLQGDAQQPFGVAAYEQLMSELMLSADDNEEQLSSKKTRIELGRRKLQATTTRYRVRVGAHSAIMETVSSPKFAWGDIAGQITTLDGNVLYKTEIIDVGGSGFGQPQVAVQAPDEDDADYDFE